MSELNDPRRLLDDRPHESLSHALAIVRNDQPTEAQVESLVRAVEHAVLIATTAAATKAVASGSSKLLALKVGTSLCMVGVCTWALVNRTEPRPKNATAPATPAIEAVQPSSTVSPTALRPGPSKGTNAHNPGAQPGEVHPPQHSDEVLVAPTGSRGGARTRKVAAPLVTPPRKAPKQGTTVQREDAVGLASPEDLVDQSPAHTSGEIELLAAAQRALRRAPSQALTLAIEHMRRYPDGTFAEERDAVEVEALAQLGRVEEARQRVDAFLHRYPASPHRSRLVQLLSDAH